MSGKFRFSQRSEKNLAGVKPQLVAVVRRALALSDVDFGITEGLRTKERQKQLVAEGKSQTMNSRHLTGDAVDVVAYVGSTISWDWPLYEKSPVPLNRLPQSWVSPSNGAETGKR